MFSKHSNVNSETSHHHSNGNESSCAVQLMRKEVKQTIIIEK